MSFSSWLRRWTKGAPARARRRRPTTRLVVEVLENRTLYSATPSWVSEGPSPILGSPYVTMANPSVTGAINGVAVNPSNPAQMYVATVNGGIWMTNNANFNDPTSIVWTPLTDQLGTLATGSIAFSPLDTTNKTLFATTGTYSSFVGNGGPAIGVLKTTDGGATWTATRLIPTSRDQPKAGIVLPTTVMTSRAQPLILVGSESGLYFSLDGGTSYQLQETFGKATIDQVVADPNDSKAFYAAVRQYKAGQVDVGGIYKGTWDANSQSITWTKMNTGLDAKFNNRIQLTAQNYNKATWLYAYADGKVFRLDPSRGNTKWTFLDKTPQGFKPAFFTNGIVADPRNKDIFYLGGEGVSQLYRYVASFPEGRRWASISGNVGPNPDKTTSIHPDFRSLVMVGKTLVATNDGGIFAVTIDKPLEPPNGPDGGFGNWVSLNGWSTGQGIGAGEFFQVVYDSNSHVIFGGAQDNGTAVQQSPGSVFWKPMFGQDGTTPMVDDTTLAAQHESIRYLSTANFENFQRQVFDASNNLVGNKVFLVDKDKLPGFKGRYITPSAVDAIAPTTEQLQKGESTRIVIGGEHGVLYEADNTGTAANAAAVDWTRVRTAPGLGDLRAVAYGGIINGANNPDLLYAADTNNHVYVRITGTLKPTPTPFPGTNIVGLALDPTDGMHLFVATANSVYETTDGGRTWNDLTGNLNSFARNLQTITVARIGSTNVVLVGGFGGVVEMNTNNQSVWTKVGANLPNAVVYSVEYNATDDVLVVSDFGRGAWEMPSASQALV